MTQEGVKSAQRVFRILEFFGQEQRDLSMTEIAHHCGFPQSSTSALMRTMTELGYLHFDRGSRTYRPTLRLPLLVSWVNTKLFNGDKILQLMQDLSEATGETILLATENGRCCRYIHVIEATGPLRLHAMASQTRPYARTACGLVLLSQWNQRRLAGFIQRTNGEEPDPALRVDLAALLKRLDGIRKDGYVKSVGGLTNVGGAVAMMLPRVESEPPMVIGIAGFQTRVEAHASAWVEKMRSVVARYFGEYEYSSLMPKIDI
ncbi:IclR family transcriptional regulator [Candidimonas nitroreducens]|uniref:IclR family transcriptional regulator n=1 Tax=Candidimonas nitroreducens TaxID=683354 RepID=A0A225M4I0_9BURK|nr:helix-turn-helix domain-containing protein [Candidimonas nitroreducens]OWT56178.1 hypothetical protein CEY11_19300 [Candidimonas nitroreducens]